MRLGYAWRFALGTFGCATALWGCEQGTLNREDVVGPGDNPFPDLTLTRGSTETVAQLPSTSHVLVPRHGPLVLDAGTSSDAAADDTLLDAAVPPDATADAGG
jgi:hypothetical protein